MSKETKKLISETIQELYLYPYRSKGENLIRSIAWFCSWLISVKGQETVSERALGGAYFIFAVSLLLEFYFEKKTLLLPRVLHGFFCALLTVMVFFALVLIVNSPSAEQSDPVWYLEMMNTTLCVTGPLFCSIMGINGILVGFDLHKCFYDSEKELKREQEANLKVAQEQFTANLIGPQEGGNAQ